MNRVIEMLRRNADSFMVFFFGFSLMGSRLMDGAMRVDNILYASISRNILTGSNKLLMTFGGEPYNNKPPLFFWINSLFIYAFGNNVFGAKLATVLATALIMVIIYRLAVKMHGSPNAGYLAVIIFITSYYVFKNSIACRMESMLTLFTLLSFYWAYLYVESRNSTYLYLSGFVSGLAVMTKGPAGALSFIVIIATLLITERRVIGTVLISLVVFLATFAWWYTYAYLNSDFINVFIGKESIDRLSAVESHFRNDPLHKYVKTIVQFTLIPYALFIAYIIRNFKRIKGDFFFQSSMVFFVLYMIVIHMLGTKYTRYLYIVTPFVAVYAVGAVSQYLRFDFRKYIFGLTMLILLFYAVYPGELSKPSYKALAQVQKFSKKNRVTIFTTPEFADNWESRAALDFYLDNYTVVNNQPNGIYVTFKNQPCKGTVLFKEKRIKVCIK